MALSATVLQEVLEQVCIVLQSKDVACSTEEFHQVLSKKGRVAITPPVSKPVSAVALGEGTCIWAASNGKNQGIVCGKQVLLGQDYCKTCFKKPSVQRKLQGGGVTAKNVKSSTSRVASTFGAKKTVEPPPPRKYNLVPIEELPGHFYVPSMHYIVRKEPNETYLVIGCGENKVERPLNEEEKEAALNLGLRVLENSGVKPRKFEDDEDLPENLE
ncbi:hypothetical protein BQ9231_00401 [Cedratvirus lausannensis]|uniref:Uncharacterized protein n=1 Tax=Cedratvirus lausannensis TaxID=2023205 RepID=A0A285PXC0_9VIRU|nr:hypothetical protein BQ9231_00401 [Cedratvirus lausannensis]